MRPHGCESCFLRIRGLRTGRCHVCARRVRETPKAVVTVCGYESLDGTCMCAVYHTPRHTWVSVGRSHDVVRRQEVGVPTSPQRLCFRLRVSEARAEVTAAALADKIRDWELTRIWERKPLVSVRVACGIDLPRCFRDHLGCAGQGRDGTGSERFPCWATAEGASQVSDRASNGFARRLPQVLAQSSHRSQEIATVAIVGTTDSPAPHHTYSIAYVSWLGEFSAWSWLSGALLSSTWGSPFSTSPRT